MTTELCAASVMTANNTEPRQDGVVTAYVLHTRKYTDSRTILECFSRELGKVSAVARINKKSTSILQPFQACQLNLIGQGNLKTVTLMEPLSTQQMVLKGKLLYCGLYLNELLLRLLRETDAYPEVYDLYEHTLCQLTQFTSVDQAETVLRAFELTLLRYMGFGVDFSVCADTELSIAAEREYGIHPELGVVSVTHKKAQLIVAGADLLHINEGLFEDKATRQTAKKVCRLLLQPHLGNKPLKSRELFC